MSRPYGSTTGPGPAQPQRSYTPFNEPFGFSIREVEVLQQDDSPGARFRSGRWKPPTQKDKVSLVNSLQRLGTNVYNSQDAYFVWRPPQNQAIFNTSTPVTEMRQEEMQFFRPHKTATVFWATDSGTFLHVPFDCTKNDVEDPLREEPESDSEERDEDDALIAYQNADVQPHAPQQPRATWRRLRFYHHHPSGDHPTISLARYTGGSNELGGALPSHWTGTLIPSVHRPEPEQYYNRLCQLAGELPLLLGLVAFNEADNRYTIAAINQLFPPSHGNTIWQSTNGLGNQLCRTDSRTRRGMVIETFYDSRRPAAQQRLSEWERGMRGPIFT